MRNFQLSVQSSLRQILKYTRSYVTKLQPTYNTGKECFSFLNFYLWLCWVLAAARGRAFSSCPVTWWEGAVRGALQLRAQGFPGGSDGKVSVCNAFDPRVGKIPRSSGGQRRLVFLPAESHGQMSLTGTVRRATESVQGRREPAGRSG